MIRINQVFLGIGIAIILALFVGYGVYSFYPSPKYENYCNESLSSKIIENRGDCLKVGGKWELFESPSVNGTIESKGNCDSTYSCRKEYDKASEGYNRIVFIATLIIGVIAVLVGGLALKKVVSISSGVMGGGVLTIIYGTIRYWGNMPDKLRFFVLGIVLGILIWISYKTYKK